MPKISYIEKRFRSETLEIIDQANAIITEYEAQGFDLTLRQLYYQFVARDLIPNTQRDYKRLGSIVNDARLAGLIDWASIVDRTRNLRALGHFESIERITLGANMSNTTFITGVHTREQAHVCIYNCDHPTRCVTEGNIYPQQRRCALERFLNDKYPSGKNLIPPGYLTLRQAAKQVGVSYDTLRQRVYRGYYPQARRAGSGRTAPWIIPIEAIT